MIWKPSILNARRPHLGQEFSARIAAKAAACDLPAACQKSAAGVLLWEDDLGRSAKSFANNMCLLHWLQIGEDRISWCPGGCFDCYFQLQIVLMFSNLTNMYSNMRRNMAREPTRSSSHIVSTCAKIWQQWMFCPLSGVPCHGPVSADALGFQNIFNIHSKRQRINRLVYLQVVDIDRAAYIYT